MAGIRREGANRFLKRVWKLVYEHTAKGDVAALNVDALTEDQKALRRDVHQTIAKVTDDIGRRQTSTPQLRRLWS
ncbi:hypothetical protein ACNKHM_03710 [Shigella sonnei]